MFFLGFTTPQRDNLIGLTLPAGYDEHAPYGGYIVNIDIDAQPVESTPCAPQALWDESQVSLARDEDASLPVLDDEIAAILADRWSVLPEPQGEPPLGILNGRFSQNSPAAPDYGWTRSGSANVQNGQGIINEDSIVFSGLREEFRIPAGATALRFTLLNRALNASAGNPPDAFEVALLDSSLNSLVPTVEGLSGSDAFLNLQASGELFFGSSTQVTGATTSGQSPTLSFPTVVTVSLAGIPAETVATLYFDLLGFGAVNSSVQIDNVTILGYDAPPLTFELAPGFDTGVPDDGITTLNSVSFVGTTDALATVTLDLDNDGFDDGTVVADTQGKFTFTNVPLVSGLNSIRAQAGIAPAQTIVSLNVTRDATGPTSLLVSPAPSSILSSNQGYVDVQWSDPASGVDPATIGISDITLTGVSIDRVQSRGEGVYRYYYAEDNQILPAGTITVQRVAGQVADLGGNLNLAASSTFTAPLLVEAGPNFTVNLGDATTLPNAKFSFAGNHNLLTLSINWGDGQTQNVPLPAGSGGANIAASHTFASVGVKTARLTLSDNVGTIVEDTVRISVVSESCPWQNPQAGLSLDVDNDGVITPADAAFIVSELNVNGLRSLTVPPVAPFVPPPFYDTSCDNLLTALDVALVVTYLNSLGGGEGEPATAAQVPAPSMATRSPTSNAPPGDDAVDQAAAAWLALQPNTAARETLFGNLAPPERSYFDNILALLADDRTPPPTAS